MFDDFSLLLQFAGFAVVVGGASVWLRSQLAKQNHEEVQELADTRGHRIEDLEKEVASLRREMQVQNAKWEAKFELLNGEFAQILAVKVAAEMASYNK